MKSTVFAGLLLNLVALIALGCKSTGLPVPISVELDRNAQASVVRLEQSIVIRDPTHDRENGFLVELQLPKEGADAGTSDRVFHVEEVTVYAGVWGLYLRERFGLKITAKGFWDGDMDNQSSFESKTFVAYPYGMQFRPKDPKAKAWLQDQIRGLWRDILQQIDDRA